MEKEVVRRITKATHKKKVNEREFSGNNLTVSDSQTHRDSQREGQWTEPN